MSSSVTEVMHYRVHDTLDTGLPHFAVSRHPGVEFRPAHKDLAADPIVGQGMRRIANLATELPDAHAGVAGQGTQRQERVEVAAEDDLLDQDAAELSRRLTGAGGLARTRRRLSRAL
jgi:hypothetical protein